MLLEYVRPTDKCIISNLLGLHNNYWQIVLPFISTLLLKDSSVLKYLSQQNQMMIQMPQEKLKDPKYIIALVSEFHLETC